MPAKYHKREEYTFMSSTELTVDEREISFVINECLDIASLKQYPHYADFDSETINILMKEGIRFAIEVVAPTRAESDRVGCVIENGRAKVPACLREPYNKTYQLGWGALNSSQEYGGQGAPFTIGVAVKEALFGANIGFSASMMLTEGVARMMCRFATKELKEIYIPKLLSGECSGTMCLSESQAGSDVGAVSTTAEKLADGRYKIKGTKCWITGGDTDLSKNVVHTVLARIKGSPSGTRGISLFLVPAFRMDNNGNITESNDVQLGSIEHKMGLNCSPTCVLNFGENNNCYGYLLGEENQGMRHMFTLMNEARLGTGVVGLGAASAAYQNALYYSKERYQGSHINEFKDHDAKRVLIIQHPDVRLQLMQMKARVEAIRALLYSVSKMLDLEEAATDTTQKHDIEAFVQLLTPMCKGWGTEVAVDVVRMSIQVLGGVGYTKDFPVEQIYRDLRVATIYEGTTGIQALDLVGRKMTMNNGALFMKLIGMFQEFSEQNANHQELGAVVQNWTKAYQRMGEAAMNMQSMMGDRGMEGAILYATPFLMFASAVTAGYFYLQQGIVAAAKLNELKKQFQVSDTDISSFLQKNDEARFYDNKLKTIRFYTDVVLPTFEANAVAMKRKNFDALDISL